KKAGKTAAKTKTTKRKTTKKGDWPSRVVVLPTKLSEAGLTPELSTESLADEGETEESIESVLYPWQVSGGSLDAATTMKFLSALPLGQSEDSAFVGDDLRYWSHLARWCLDR
ncbi:MAG: hypothetical protein AAGJ80_14875, partial [Cyanobacteria bacterium J06553_1]